MSQTTTTDITIIFFPVLKDNFQYLIHNKRKAWVVDPADHKKISQFLEVHNLELEGVLVTHEHADHICALGDIVSNHKNIKVVGSSFSQLPFYTDIVEHNQIIHCLDQEVQILSLPGHTTEQVGYYFKKVQKLFSGDALFHLGCGRIFAGTFEEHFESMQKIKNLPESTEVFCSHDYTTSNLKFCESYLQRSFAEYPEKHKIPLLLKNEKDWNPFLQAATLKEFTELRTARNKG